MLFRVYVGAVYFARYTWLYIAMFIWLKFSILPQTVGQSSPSTNAFRLFNQDFALSSKSSSSFAAACCAEGERSSWMLDDSNVQSRSMLLLLAGNPTNFHSLQTLLRFRNYSAAAAVSSLQHCAAEAVCSIAELCNTLCTSNCVLCAEQSQLTLQLYLKEKTVVCRVCQINWVTASTWLLLQ